MEVLNVNRPFLLEERIDDIILPPKTKEQLFVSQPEKELVEENIGLSQSHLTRASFGGPRLIITHIENVNFKSYAGTQVLGPFQKSFSSIVGPNGSGKSNVIDAMLFVFGYRSKKIRSKKLSLLIHNSENHQHIDSCTVTVHFQKIIDKLGDDYEVVPNSSFNVSRTARKDGSSDYYLNGTKQTFKEIGVILRSCGIDLDHNRFLILQGEVEQISMMKPKAESEHDDGMLEYLEDIIGTSRFKEPIELCCKSVEELNEVRGEKLNRVKAVEKEKDDLEEAKNEAMEFLTLENDLTVKKHTLFQSYIHECGTNEMRAREKLNEVQKQLDELQSQLNEFTEKKKEKGKDHKKITKLFDKLVAEAEEKKKAFSEFEKYDLKLREDLKHRKQNKKKFDKSLEQEMKKLEELRDVPTKSAEEIEKCTKSLEDLEAKKSAEEEALDKIMQGLKHETRELQAEKEGKQAELMEKQKFVNEAKSNMDIAGTELDIYMSQHKNLVQQLETAKGNAERARCLKEECTRHVSAFEEDVKSSGKELSAAAAELEKLTNEENELTAKVRTNRKKLEESRSAMEVSKSRDAVIDALMSEKKNGTLRGIFGRLGDLGAIDDKYDVAISTACGPLDFMVCDTMDTAQRCVEFLKKTGIGSTTFIALDKVEHWRSKAAAPIQIPARCERLYDLVRIEDKTIATAFYFALKDTLVANDLEHATRTALPEDPKAKRWRVVTLNGELIETSGTMSGGGTKVAKGRMGCRVVPEEALDLTTVVKLEGSVEKDLHRLDEVRKRKCEIEETVLQLKKRLSSGKHNLEKSRMEIQSLSAQEREQSERVLELEVQVKKSIPDFTQVKKLEKTFSEFEKTYKKAFDAAGVIEKEVEKLHNKIMEISKSKVKGQQAKLDSINSLIDEVTQKRTKANVALKSAGRNLAKAEEKVASVQKEIEENNAAIEKMQIEFTKLEEEATKVLEEHQQAQDQMKEMESELEAVRAAFSVVEKEEVELKSKELDLKHEAGKYDTVAQESHGKVKYWQKELAKLTLHEVKHRPSASEETVDSSARKLTLLSTDEVQRVDKEAISYEITVIEENLKNLKPNMGAIQDYFKKEEVYLARVKELDEVTDERDAKRKEHDSLRKQRLDEFMAGFSVITAKLKEMYQMITLGGDAELELVDSLDPFSEGIVFSVRPPKKSWKNISNLSGGEKTLSSLALVFALHHYKPSPLYVMDEIDAALDFKNVSIVANYIKERTKNAQFIIISLRNNMFELADRLIGIYKTDNCTKSVVINPNVFEAGTAKQ